MRNIGLFEYLINFMFQKLMWIALIGGTLAINPGRISKDQKAVFTGDTYEIKLSEFSPAFAAFEDEFLFDDSPGLPLQSGLSEQTFASFIRPTTDKAEPKVTLVKSRKTQAKKSQRFFGSFDGESSLQNTQATQKHRSTTISSKPLAAPKKELSTLNAVEELKFGSLVAMVNPNKPKKALAWPTLQNPPPFQRNANSKNNSHQNDINGMDDDKKSAPTFETYKVTGGIQLKQGLAFVGSMELSWVVGDYELQRGSIDTRDATFAIEVSKLVGDIVVSLYNSDGYLIGEGFLDLTTARTEGNEIHQKINVHPIDWDTAGIVVDSGSLGTGGLRPVEGAEVALYAFNDATKTNKLGKFSFYNWKKTNSKTLAIASKDGFRDSLFVLDSNTTASVLLFSETYLEDYFAYLQNQGIYDTETRGTVYGKIQGLPDVSGYSVHLGKAKPVYFMTAGLASIEMTATSTNGQFSFVGLQDGDYDLSIEKNGEVIDQRVVVVEQGKLSPVIVDLGKVSKQIQFFDPMNPDRALSQLELSFFDGVVSKSVDTENSVKQAVNKGFDVSVMEFATDVEVNRTLLSRHKGLQKVPLINDKRLLDLATQAGFSISDGLVVGFVKSEVPYRVGLVEHPPQKVIYFDKMGQMIEEDTMNSVAYGYVLAGFPAGLSSLYVETLEDSTILGTDLIYSNHESVSVSHLEVLSIQ